MLYKPNYCCHCGESVERIEWKLWTSRRFCGNCEVAFRREDWLLRIGLILAGIGGLFGFGTYLKTPERPLDLTPNQLVVTSSNKAQNVKSEQIKTQPTSSESLKSERNSDQSNNRIRPENTPNKEKRGAGGSEPNESAENVYFCGAQTKKGTPCTRKVRGGGRCWQHTGQPALLPSEKLLAGQ